MPAHWRQTAPGTAACYSFLKGASASAASFVKKYSIGNTPQQHCRYLFFTQHLMTDSWTSRAAAASCSPSGFKFPFPYWKKLLCRSARKRVSCARIEFLLAMHSRTCLTWRIFPSDSRIPPDHTHRFLKAADNPDLPAAEEENTDLPESQNIPPV